MSALLAKAREEHTKRNLFENNGPDFDNAADEDPEGDDVHEDEQALKRAQFMCKFLALCLAFGNPNASDLHKAALSGSSGSVSFEVLVSQQRSSNSQISDVFFRGVMTLSLMSVEPGF